MKRLHLMIVVVLLVLFAGIGWLMGQRVTQSAMAERKPANDSMKVPSIDGVVQDGSGRKVKYWYDPMVPDRRFDKPGKSPFMDMPLEPKYANEGADGEETGITISSQTTQNLGIRLEKASMKHFGDALSAIGRIEPDERRIYAVQTRIPGFVERLSIRAIGDPVNKGQKIAEVYAPDLFAAQQEYLTLRELHAVDSDNTLKQAAFTRLTLLGMTAGEIAAIEKSGKASPRFGVYAPASGIVTQLGVREGGQLMAGSSLVQISNLSQVWMIAEVPERDAARLKPGITAEVQLQSIPGEVFKGKLSYLYPILNDSTRTVQVRIELPNNANRLRPGMYANVEFTGQTHEALSVPTESMIATGKRMLVIVKEDGRYRPVEIKAGQERDGYTEVLDGLHEGEQVIVSGQFLIDSEASLSGVLARLSQPGNTTSMENSPAEKMPRGHGKVVDVDATSNHITLHHDQIPEVGWPAMTMGFKVRDRQQLMPLKAGDEVDFSLKAEAAVHRDMPAQYIIERIEKVDAMKSSLQGAKP